MKLLILGSCGFVGSNLCEYLANKNHDITGCDIINFQNNIYSYYDLSEHSSVLDKLLLNNKFDVCINASGLANVPNSFLNPFNDFDANVHFVAKVLEAIRVNQPECKYLHISSAAVYGNPGKLPIVESAPLNPVSPYGYNKMIAEILCKKYFTLFNIPITIIRPFSIFGNGLKKQILWDTCSKFKKLDSVVLFGKGDETRDFIHISDFCEMIHTVICKSDFNLEIFNSASGVQTTIADFAKIVSKHYLNTKEIIFNGETKAGDPKYWLADITAISKLGFIPKADLNISIAEYIQWFNKVFEKD
jgi:UDP-glucose 4-epimerase